MPKSRYYKLLGLPTTASERDIRKKFRQLAMKYHPDRNSDPGAEEIFIQLTEAYEVLLNKVVLPNATLPQKSPEEDKIIRAKMARQRYAEQVLRERQENDRYFHQLTSGLKWKIIRLAAVAGLLISSLLAADLILPHHFEENEITHFRRNVGYGPSGQLISLVKTANNDYYWISRITFSLYGKTRHVYVESSWFFHNPIRLISREKLGYKVFDTHFTFYNATFLLILIFLLPTATILYKRKKISFTFLYYTCIYGVNALLLLFLLTGNRWAHVLCLGFF